LGYADTFDVITGIAAIEMVLKDLGYPVKLGTGRRGCPGNSDEIIAVP